MSASTPGNIDCALALEVKAYIADIWDESGSIAAEYIADVETVKAIKSRQTARMTVLENPSKDRELKVWWPDDCRVDTPVPCTDQCEVDGPMAGTQCKDYTLDECFELGISWTEEMFRTSEMSAVQFESVMTMKLNKLMDEELNRKAIALLDLAAGVNKYEDQYPVVDGVTYIPASAWTGDLAGYLYMIAKINKISVPNLVNGLNLMQYAYLTEKNVTDPYGASNLAKLRTLGTPVWDITLDALLGQKASFLWNSNAVVIANKARHAAYPSGRTVQTATGPVFWYTSESRNVPGITYDAYRKETCANDDVKHTIMMKFRGAFLTNPIGCDTDRTGVLKLICGVPA